MEATATAPLALVALSGLNFGYSLLLTAFRQSTFEIDNGLVTLAEDALSGLLLGAVYGLSKLDHGLLMALPLASAHFLLSMRINRKYVGGRAYTPVNLEGKVYIVTGCNTGIGFETAKALAAMGATVVMACRSPDKAQEARESILRDVRCAQDKVRVLKLDLCDFDSVRKFVEEFKALDLPLHALINNAGIMSDKRMTTSNGMEMNMMANHLSHFLLTVLLLPALEKTNGRVVNLTSTVHKVAKSFDFDDMMSEKKYEMFATYGQSKLANILFTRELQKRLLAKGANVACYAVHPGCVRTEVTRNMAWWMQLGNALAFPVMVLLQKTPPQGAYSSIYTATDPRVYEDRSFWGKYFFHCEVSEESEAARDDVAAKRLWEISEELTGLKKKDRSE